MSKTEGVATRRHWILTYRHSVVVRITHWINVFALALLLMSGLQIFNAHPSLYWGDASDFDHPWLSLTAQEDSGKTVGLTKLGGWEIPTTGLLGYSRGSDGQLTARGFPTWATLPSDQNLATGRVWHFFFAWVFVLSTALYLIYGVVSRHVWRDLLPNGTDLRHFGRSVWQHLRLHLPRGEEARRYNVLQKLTYLVVVFLLFPLMLLTGLTMAPRVVAGFPQLLWVFGGRQSARSIHFICAFSLVAFVLIHVFMVVVSGPLNNLRSMITGRYAVEDEGGRHVSQT